ncbi:MAG: metallophosphoesterase [Rhodothermia bacterium]|nr:metallophosphoesterase [Rhodothermia bacterium]
MRFACLLISALAAVWFAACGSTKLYVAESDSDWQVQTPPNAAAEVYRILLVGDVGAPATDRPDPVLTALKQELNNLDENAAVIFLGDNIYCCGLPDSGSAGRAKAERRLLTILQAVEDFDGRILFVPGNHDWNSSRVGGLESVRRQERFVEEYLDRGNTFVPDNGFPGPVEVDLTDDITVLAIDTEWWLTDHAKSFGDDGKNEIEEPADFLLELREEVLDEDDKKLLVVGHHPLHSNGEHAGFFPLHDHVFPLTQLWKKAYVPLPILGSIPLLYARYFGASEQDLGHHRYRQLRSSLDRIFAEHENLVYASGHEHNLQYFKAGPFLHPVHYVVSGSGSKRSPVTGGHDAVFAAGVRGYASLHYYDDDSVWLSFWRTDVAGEAPTLLFRTRLKDAAVQVPDTEVAASSAEYPDYSDSVKVIAINPEYGAGALKRAFLGSHHRDLWTTPVAAPYLDMGRTAGGLTPVKRGGGLQTTSIRLRGANGKQYVLRSLDKDPSRSIPPSLKNTVAVDIVQDQVTSINPYGAYMIPPMAAAIGIFHTDPQLVYVPDDPRLEPFRNLVAGRLMMFEDRPDDDMSDEVRYGRSKDVESASKMYESINEDNDDYVDQQMFVKARLFDMLISDWDRHRDQWRWASFDNEGKGRHFKPIPRDRDWAFNKMNGLFPSMARYFDPKFQDFEKDYGSIRGLTGNGLEQDRRFTAALTRADWLQAANHIQDALTDEVIDDAVRRLPEPIYEQVGQDIALKLRLRRDKLHTVAETYYELLAATVDIVGSHKHERFVVRPLDRETTEVLVYKTSKEGEIRKQIYQRTFSASETDELRLYGLGGNDTFELHGSSPSIKVRAIGGPGEDRFVNDAGALSSRFHVYDTEKGNAFELESGKVTRTDDPFMTSYNPKEYKHDSRFPRAFFGSNPDDGVFVGGGIRTVSHGFKKLPYARENTLLANFAAKTGAFNVVYRGHFVRAIGPYDLLLNASWLSPNNIRNFYGLGNETENEEDDRKFYQAQFTQINVSPRLRLHHPLGATFEFGTFIKVTDVKQDADRFTGAPQAGVSPSSFDDQWFTGAHFSAVFSKVDQPGNPRQGFRMRNDFVANIGVRNATDSYGKIGSDLTIYMSPSLSPQLTFAARIGVEHTMGSFPFYDASTLGGANNLRGHRSTRFAGRTAFYQNLEMRLRLLRFSAYLANGDGGILGFIDNGRVWTEVDAPNRTWHQGYGGGLWAHVLDTFTIATWVGASADDFTYTLTLGFQY